MEPGLQQTRNDNESGWPVGAQRMSGVTVWERVSFAGHTCNLSLRVVRFLCALQNADVM